MARLLAVAVRLLNGVREARLFGGAVLAGKRHQGGKQQWQRGQQLASDDFHSVSREKNKNTAHFMGHSCRSSIASTGDASWRAVA